MSNIDKQALLKIAESVDREEWDVLDNGDADYQVIVSGSLERGATYRSYQPVANEISEQKIAAFIAAFNPKAALALLDECAALAAENAGLKAAKEIIRHLNVNREEANFCGIDDCYIDDAVAAMITPATDAFLAEVRAGARNEGINYAASRLAAAFNHGFLDKLVSEVLDVTRMILLAKEDLANDPLPAADGLSGEYAEKSIEEWAAQLRKGASL
ncbi:ead/Ea22-like family protein [Salmonella enterica]